MYKPIGYANISLESAGDMLLTPTDTADSEIDFNQSPDMIRELDNFNAAMEAYRVCEHYRRHFIEAGDSGADIKRNTAHFINSVVKNACVKASLEDYPQINLSNYDGRQARAVAIRASLEGFTEAIRRILELIGRILKKIYLYVYDDIENTVRGAEAIVRRCGRIHDRAVAVQKGGRDFNRDDRISSGELQRFFNKNGKILFPDEIARNYEKYNDELNKRFSSSVMESGVNAIMLMMERDLRSVGVSKYTQEHAFKAGDAGLKNFKNNALRDFELKGSDSSDTYSYELPFANSHLLVTLMSESGHYTGMVADIVTEKVSASDKLIALKPLQIREFCRMIEGQMNGGIYKDFRRIKSAIVKAGKSLEDACDMVKREQQNVESGTVVSLGFMRSVIVAMTDLTKILYGYNGATNRRLMTYCEISLRNWE